MKLRKRFMSVDLWNHQILFFRVSVDEIRESNDVGGERVGLFQHRDCSPRSPQLLAPDRWLTYP
jgi:hypothetical protein